MPQSLKNASFTVKKLHGFLESGKFAVPKLQRVFVWNAPKAVKLIDSVYRSMPIGALTVWETTRAHQNILRTTSKVLPEFKPNNPNIWFLLDGQQRLSVLYRILKGGEVSNGASEVNFEKLVFRVSSGGAEGRFRFGKVEDKLWVKVTDILKDNWRKSFEHLAMREFERVKICRNNILNYKVPIVIAEMNDIEDARELFIRINVSGTPLAAADRAFARASRFDLREKAEETLNGFTENFKRLSNEVLLQTRALLDDINEVGVEAMNEVADKWNEKIRHDHNMVKNFQREWNKQNSAMGRSLDLLRNEFCVLNASVLPASNMVATLTVFFAQTQRAATPEQLIEIRKWFWGTALAQRYSGRGYRGHILSDVGFFKDLAAGKKVKFRLEELIDPANIKNASYLKRSTISDAFYCLLIKQKPIDLINGSQYQVDAFVGAANKKHKHHIFPQKFLKNEGVGQTTLHSILNLCFISAELNSQFGSSAPINYLDPYRNKAYFNKAMERHLIPVDDSGIWLSNVSGYRTLIKQRQEMVCNAFEKVAGMSLFRKDAD